MMVVFVRQVANLCGCVICLAMFGAFFVFNPVSVRVSHAQASGNTWTVNNTGDSGTTTCTANAGSGGAACQLRDALSKAVNGDTITFGVSGTITLGARLPIVTITLTIDGAGQSVTISGNNAVGVLSVGSMGNLTLKGLTIANGNSVNGGGVDNEGGIVSISNSTFSGNSSLYGGGGVYNKSGTVTINT